MNDIIELSGPELPPKSGGTPKQLVILLHGVGADGADLIGLAPEFSNILPDAHFISPTAPFNCDMSPFGYQWFSLHVWTPEALSEGAREAAPILNHYIDKMLQRFGLGDDKLAIVGFSQGTMMALQIAVRRPQPCAGVLGYSGALLDAEPFEEEVISRPPICLVHGVLDAVVPFIALENSAAGLREVGVDVETHDRPLLGHMIDPEGISIGKNFLKKAFSL